MPYLNRQGFIQELALKVGQTFYQSCFGFYCFSEKTTLENAILEPDFHNVTSPNAILRHNTTLSRDVAEITPMPGNAKQKLGGSRAKKISEGRG
jgi:hypothetical protein